MAVARCTVERFMRRLGLAGVRRGKRVRTTTPDTSAPCPLDRVNRQFRADRPNQRWVFGLLVCLNLTGRALRGLRRRRVCPTYHGLACQHHYDHGLRARRTGASILRPTT